VETFGRHARVAFTDDWEADAARRDFTMNALYADADGTIYDPTGGLNDLARGHVRFVGDPRARIAEDVLRLLRFFRFHAHYGRGAPDKAALAACHAFAPQVKNLSGERVRAELFRLLEAKDPARITALMARIGVLRPVVPGLTNHRRLATVAKRETKPDALRRLAAGLSLSGKKLDALADRLRLSNAERARLAAMLGTPRPTLRMSPRARRRLLYRIGPDAYRDRALLAGYPKLAAVRAKPPKLPMQGRDLVARGVKPGPEVGHLLAAVERWWIGRDFKPGRAQCLQYAQGLASRHGTASRTNR
jgi:poly(A) polymerase